MYNWIARHVLARALDSSRGTKTMRCLNELEKSQWWSRNNVLELQNERLSRLIRYAYDNVPYYGRLFDEWAVQPNDIKCTRDLAKLPVLNKHLIRSNFSDLKSRGFPFKKTVLASTGGSAGEPLMFYSTKDDQLNWGYARGLRARGWTGYKMGDKIFFLHKRMIHPLIQEKIIKWPKALLERSLFLDPATMSMETMSFFIQKIEESHPKFIAGYPSAIYLLARFIEREGRLRFRPEAVMTGGEQLYDHQRELLEKVFECETYNNYSSWEVHNIASECPEHMGLHIAVENITLEVVDDAGLPVPIGREGRILLTNLHNYAMPLIRYDIDDLGVLSDKVCSCGRGLPLLSKLSGRTTDVILTRSGRLIPGIALPFRFLARLGVEQFQMLQESYDSVIIKLILEKEYPREHSDKLTKEIKGQYQPILGEDVDITVQFVDQIATTAHGKRKIVISNLPVAK